MDRRACTLLLALTPVPTAGQVPAPAPGYDRAAAVRDAELAAITGKFVLSNGAELALSVVSDAAVDGRAVLRTVFTLDRAAELKVYARPVASADAPTVTTAGGAPPVRATAAAMPVTVMFDRQTGARLISPVGGAGGPAVAVGGAGAAVTQADAAAGAAARGLAEATPVPGGPAVATADGTLALARLPNGAAVTLAGDRYGVMQLVGRTVAAATVNSASDRVLDSVTDVSVDLRNVTPFTVGGAMMRADDLALDVASRMVR